MTWLVLAAYALPMLFVWRWVARSHMNKAVDRMRVEFPSMWRHAKDRARLLREARGEAAVMATAVAVLWPIALPLRLIFVRMLTAKSLITDYERAENAEQEAARLRRDLAEAKRIATQYGMPFPDDRKD